ncbi:MAG: DinB family protein [Terriglobales bacterium]|jgi:uncharacterized damage-inducible protein DinB
MKRVFLMLLCAVAAIPVAAQVKNDAGGDKNPVVTAARKILDRQSRNLSQAADEMPPGDYSFKPTTQQMAFSELVGHIAESNQFLCAKLAGMEPPKEDEGAAKAPKETLVKALKASFAVCTATLEKLEDTDLGQPITMWGGRSGTKAAALFSLTNDWADHYSAAAMYLRLKGLLPPTAKKN